MRSVLPMVGPLLGAGILAALGIAGGMVLLVIPGLYLFTIWSVIAPVIVVERRKAFDAFGRSRQLVRGNGWPVLWIVLVAFLIAIAAALVFVEIAATFSDLELIRIVFNAFASMVTAPIAALVASVLYFRLLTLQPQTASPPETAI
jgi:predicted neutral ceramidase superfamily lipid hydrolase